jgi:glycosyltransferase involved in cell wall biosynthesis
MSQINKQAVSGLITPLVSVCIPTYKGGEFISKTIDSVINQTYKNIELIIVDDKSPDDTASVVKNYSDPRIRYVVNQTNLGPEANWIKCQQLASGVYFKLLPHDDIIAAECVEKQVAILESDTDREISIVFGMREIIGPNGKILMTRGIPGGNHGRIASNELISTCVRSGANIIGEPGNGMIRRELIEKIGGYDAKFPYLVDLDYWFRVLRHGDGFYMKNVTSSFRLTAGSWSAAIGIHQFSDFKGFVENFSADPRYSISRLDRLIGLSKAVFNTAGRIVIYKFLF